MKFFTLLRGGSRGRTGYRSVSLLYGRGRRELLLPARLGTTVVTFVVDSGASCSMVSEETVRRCGLDWQGGCLRTSLVVGDGLTLQACLSVVPKCNYSLLGLDVLYAHQCCVLPFRHRPKLLVRDTVGRQPLHHPLNFQSITIDGQQAAALCDTGATSSSIDQDTAKKLGLQLSLLAQPVRYILNFGETFVTE